MASFGQPKTTYGDMNDWRQLSKNVPHTVTDTNWKEVSRSAPSYSRPVGEGRMNEFSRHYDQLSRNLAHRYPNPGTPRERQGRIGGTWRHIKEVLGHGGSRVVFVDGLVSLYDSEKALSGSRYLRDKLAGPSYAPNYQQMLQRDLGSWSAQPPVQYSRGPNLANLPAAPIPPPSPESSRYRGYYRHN